MIIIIYYTLILLEIETGKYDAEERGEAMTASNGYADLEQRSGT